VRVAHCPICKEHTSVGAPPDASVAIQVCSGCRSAYGNLVDFVEKTHPPLLVSDLFMDSKSEILLDLLRKLEWNIEGECPICFGDIVDGHKEGCSLALALESE
jgi:hypothetical protein